MFIICQIETGIFSPKKANNPIKIGMIKTINPVRKKTQQMLKISIARQIRQVPVAASAVKKIMSVLFNRTSINFQVKKDEIGEVSPDPESTKNKKPRIEFAAFYFS